MARSEYLKNSCYSMQGQLCLDDEEDFSRTTHASNAEHLISNEHCDGEDQYGEDFEIGVSKHDYRANDEISRIREESFLVDKGGHEPYDRKDPIPESYWDSLVPEDDDIIGDDDDE